MIDDSMQHDAYYRTHDHAHKYNHGYENYYTRVVGRFVNPHNPYMLALSRYTRSHREFVYLFLLPALYFRFFPFLLTHNSTPLSIYLAVVVVFIPGQVVLAAWRAYKSTQQPGSVRRRRSSSSVLPSSRTSPRRRRSENDRPLARGVLWVCGALLTAWVYLRGLSSPFPSATSIIASSPTLQAHRANNASYFIAASLYNNDDILGSWGSQMLELIDILGRSNVYVSLTENDSTDKTVRKLMKLDSELARRNIPHSVNVTAGLRGDPPENPWKSVKHRMQYMTNLRNGALKPLDFLNRRFENVILLNDVVYHHTDVLKLIAAVGGDDISAKHDDGAVPRAHGGRPAGAGKRRMACGVDMDGATLYDAWVLRDRCGRPVSGFWPFFTSEEDKAAVREGRTLDVATCWNGMVVLDADMLLAPKLRTPGADWDAEPLRFRDPPECKISECALFPLTIANVTGGAPVVMDPTVVVSYSVKWWKYYAVWLRMPVVQVWMSVFEERYWRLWWAMGMGEGLKWLGLDDGKEKGECVAKGLPTCRDGDERVEFGKKGAIRLVSKKEEL